MFIEWNMIKTAEKVPFNDITTLACTPLPQERTNSVLILEFLRNSLERLSHYFRMLCCTPKFEIFEYVRNALPKAKPFKMMSMQRMH